MEHSLYHKTLRVSAVVCALVLLFDSGFLSPITQKLSHNTTQYLAQSVGVQVGVAETDLSKWTAELTVREQALAEREAALGRTIESRSFDSVPLSPSGPVDYSTYILATVLFLLTVLIVLNYALDWSRFKRIQHAEQIA